MTGDSDDAQPPRADPRSAGLWAAVVHNGALNTAAWRRAAAGGDIVGTCRACGGYLVPDTPPVYGDGQPLTWFIARCLSCDAEFASPDGRLARRHGPQAPPRTRH